MKKRILSMALVLCMALTLLPMGVLAAELPTNGAGTQASPYQIGTAQELINFAAWYNSLDFGSNLENIKAGEIYVQLTDNIDLNPGFVFTENGYTGDGTPIEWTPIGNSVTAPHGFFGVFDGGGHSISGVYINEQSSTGNTAATGLFRYVDSNNLIGTVKNLEVKNSYIGSKSHATGSIVGVNCGTVDNCKSSAFVHVTASMGSFGGIGGIVGNNNNYWATTKNCAFTGSVVADNASGTPYIGGIVGHNYKGYVGNCTNSGKVAAMVDKVGGIVGANIPLNTSTNDKKYGETYDGKVEGCVNTGVVTGTDYVGGIVGYSETMGTVFQNGSILGCTNRGTVSASGNNGAAGGVVGYCNDTDVKDCNNYAIVSAGSATNLGGIVGTFYGKTLDNCRYLQSATVNNGLNLVGWSKTGASAPTDSGVLSAPSSPTDVKTVAGDAQVTLSWTAPSSTGGSAAITEYKVAYSTTDTAPTEVSNWTATNSTNTEYTVSGLENGTTYYFWVKAMSEAGESAASSSVSATPMAAIVVTFNANGGTCGTATLTADEHGKLASLPIPTRSGSYTFDGWYTSEIGGTQITTGSSFTESATVYAHWTYTGGSGGDFTPPSVTVPVSGDEGTVSVSASVSDSTATITVTDQQLAEIAGNAAGTGAVTVDLSGIKNVDSAKIPAKMVAAANTATGAGGLEIILPTGTVKLDEKALASVASSNTEITVSVEEVKTSGLTAAQKEALGDKLDSAVVVDVNVLV
ncbi:MAG: fibronectin type III domain-containing protein, partial [Oscillospiraceae bacterium]